MENADPKRVIVTASCCQGCGVHVVLVHHETFPEMRVEALSAERAAGHLANRLEATVDAVSDPSHREAVLRAGRRPSIRRPGGLRSSGARCLGTSFIMKGSTWRFLTHILACRLTF